MQGQMGAPSDFGGMLGVSAQQMQRSRRSDDRYDSQNHRDEVHKNENLYRNYQSSQTEWSEQASEDLEFANGVHWSQEQINTLLERGQMPMSINTTWQVVQQAVGLLTHENPSFRAIGREDSDRRMGDVVADVLQWIWQQSDGKMRLKQAAEDAYVKGRGVMMAYPDPNGDMGKGEVKVTDLDPQQVFPDPNSTDPLWDDAANIVVRRLFTKEEVGHRWPNVDLSNVQTAEGHDHAPTMGVPTHNEQLHPDDVADTYHETYEVIERFTKVRRPYVRAQMPDRQTEEVMELSEWKRRSQQPAYIVQQNGQTRAITQEKRVREIAKMEQQFGSTFHFRRPRMPQGRRRGPNTQPPRPEKAPGRAVDDPRAVPNSTVRLRRLTVGALAEAGWVKINRFQMERIKVVATIGREMLYEPRILETSNYPVVPIQLNHQRNPYPVSDVRMVKDLQKAINKTNSLILAHAANSTNQKVFTPRGTTNKEKIERDFAKAGSQVFEYDPTGLDGQGGSPIEVVGPPPLPKALYQNMSRFVTLMQQILGVFQMQQGEAANAPDTYNGTLAMDEYGQRRIKSKMDVLYNALERLGSVALDFAQDTYNQKKVFRLVQPNMPPKERRVNQPQYDDFGNEIGRFNDLTVGRYDVMVKAGSTLPSNRWAQLQQLIDLYSAGIVDDQAVLKKTELPNAEKILQRSGTMQKMKSAIEKQKETIDDLKGDIQTWMRRARNNAQKAELEKFKARLDTVHQDMAKAQQVYEESLESEKEKQEALMKERRKQAAKNLQNRDQQ